MEHVLSSTLDHMPATGAVTTAVKIPAAKVLTPDNNIFSLDIRPKNIPRLNIILMTRITEMIVAMLGSVGLTML